MLQGEHSAILSTFIKQPFVIKIFLSIFEWPLKTGFTVYMYSMILSAQLYYIHESHIYIYSKGHFMVLLIHLFVCCFTSQVNSYGHGGTVSSPNHTFSWASLNKQLTSTSCTYFRLLLTTTLLIR